MAKNKKSDRGGSREPSEKSSNKKGRSWVVPLTVALILAGAGVAFLAANQKWSAQPARPQPTTSSPPPATTPAPAPAAQPAPPSEGDTMEVARAVMVTEELDFGPKIPTVAEALGQIERRYGPADGQGRTFAILDADGWPTPDGKLHIQMHVSTEKPGTGSLVFKRTGKTLWSAKITGTPVPSQKNLGISIDNGAGKTLNVDGSNNPASILDANLKDMGVPVKSIWPDKTDRELTFIYSACGCPVKVTARREGDRTVRTTSKRLDGSERAKDLPVMFPDDPAAVSTIAGLMRW
jgi:hypothetical protein